MADNQSRALVVVDVLPSPWASNHAEVVLQNTGAGPAFDVRVRMLPEVPLDYSRKFPFASVSLLRPGQSLRSYFTEFRAILDKPLSVSISWASMPGGSFRSSLEYTLNIPEMEGRGELGGDPAVKAAESLKKIAEELDRFTRRGELTVQVHTHEDRQRAAQAHRERMAARTAAGPGEEG